MKYLGDGTEVIIFIYILSTQLENILYFFVFLNRMSFVSVTSLELMMFLPQASWC